MKRITIILFFTVSTLFASTHTTPTWVINPNDYQYSMSVVGLLNLNCSDLANANNKVAAFVNGECRGVAQSNSIVNGKNLAYLIIYSNSPLGETVELKYYNAANDLVYTAKETIQFTDNAAFGKNNSPYLIRNNDAPTKISLSTKLVIENAKAGIEVASITVLDPDKLDTHTLSFAQNGADNSFFFIDGNKLKVLNTINTATKDTLKIKLRATDNLGCFLEKEFSLIVDKINDAPTGLFLSDSVFFENTSAPFVGSFSSTDPDLIDKFKYSFTIGTGDVDNAKFSIVDSNLFFKSSANFEVKKTYSVRVRVTDIGGLTYDKAFSIHVKDNNDPPTNIVLSNTKVYENELSNQLVAKMSTIDEDTWDKYEYTFANIGTNDNTSFQIVNDSLKAKKVFDFETKDSYVIYLISTDSSGVSFTKSFTITIKDTLDAPTDLKLSNTTITENLPKGTFIGKLSTVEAKSLIPVLYTFSLVSGEGSTDNARFYISKDSLYSNEPFDYERNKQFSIRARAALVNGMKVEKELLIMVNNVSATSISLSNNRVFENEAMDQFVAKISTISTDTQTKYDYTFANIGTNDNASFSISNDTLRANKVFDFEAKSSYNIYLTSTDSSNVSINKIFTIYVKDALDVPKDILLDNATIVENRSKMTLVGVLSTVDANIQPVVYAYSLVSGKGSDDNSRFIVRNDSVFSNEVFDFEKKKSYNIRTKTTLVNGISTEKEFVISIIDVLSTNITLSNSKVFENEPAVQFVAKISTITLDTSDSYKYSFGNIGSNDNVSFAISNDSLFANKVFDFETKNSFVVYLVSTSLSGVSITRPFTIMIKDSLDVPTDIALDNKVIVENLPAKTFIGKLNTADANKQPVIYTYALVSGKGSDDNARFIVRNDSVFSNEVFDFEKKKSYNIRTKTTLVNGMSTEKEFVISIVDVLSTNITLSNSKVFENEPINQFVAKISTVTLDTSDSYKYSFGNIGSNDNVSFAISNDSLFANKVFDFETKNSFVVYLVSTSLSGVSITRPFTIMIKDSLDVPTDIALDYKVIVENLPAKTFIGKLNTVDANKQPIIYTYALVSGKGSTDNGSFLVRNDSLYSNEVFDFEKKNNYNIRTKTTLVNGMSTEKEFVISIVDVLSTSIALSNSKVFENEPMNQFVAKISTITLDTSDSYKYSFGNIGSNDNVSFAISNDSLFANKVFDFETKNSFVVYLVSTSLSGVSITRPFTIIIKDSLDVPTDIALDNNIIVETLPSNTFIGKLNTIDANRQPVLYTYALVSGNGSADNGNFIVRNDSVFSNEVFDFEKKITYDIRIRSTLVNKMYFEKTFVITIKDIPSTNIVLNNNKVYENEPANQFVAKISTVTLDTSDFYTYSLGNVGTNDNISFTIVKDTLKAKKVFDFETKNEYNVYIVSTSLSGISITRPFTIFIKDSLDQPTDLVLASTSMPENAPKNTFIGKLSTIDANTQPVKYTYSFVSGLGSIDSSQFSISNDSLFNKEMFDFEARNSYAIRIRSTLVNSMYVEKTFKMSVLNVNERPVFLSINRDSIPENTADSTYVASFATIDPDKGDRFVYTLVTGANDAGNKAFTIKNGILLLVKPTNFEKQSSYQIRVRTTDNGGEILDSVLTIYIKDLNEQCRIVPQTYEVLELAAQQTELGNIEVKDEDKNQTYLFEIQNLEVPFSINASTGMLVLNGRIDYEKKKQYEVWVKITDSGNPALSDSLSMRVNVLDEIEDDILPSADLVSPNGDEKNDTWKITNVALYKDFALDIVDENGQSVYSVSSNYNNDWDAKFRGSPLPIGVYYYVFKSNANGKLYKGYITVVK